MYEHFEKSKIWIANSFTVLILKVTMILDDNVMKDPNSTGVSCDVPVLV
jgi:hypothetical protein